MGTVISCGLHLNRPRAQPKRKPTLGKSLAMSPNVAMGTCTKDLYRLMG
jgi:hypothetical protein